MEAVEIWHNPRCSKSRQTLELLRARGIDPRVVRYLEEPPSTQRLGQVLALLGLDPRGLMRKKESVYSDLGLANQDHSSEQLIAAMAEHPILIERPIVICHDRAAIGRPPEQVQALFEE